MLQCSGPGERERGEWRVGTRNSKEDWPPSLPGALKGIAGMAPPKNGVAAYYYYYYYYITLHYTTAKHNTVQPNAQLCNIVQCTTVQQWTAIHSIKSIVQCSAL